MCFRAYMAIYNCPINIPQQQTKHRQSLHTKYYRIGEHHVVKFGEITETRLCKQEIKNILYYMKFSWSFLVMSL